MKITKIEKKKRLYLLEVDQIERLYVTEDTIVRFMLSKGMDIDEEALKEIQSFAQFSHGKNLALYHISFKQRTEVEVRKYLTEHEIDQEIIGQVLKTLKEDKWIDDAKYVESFMSQNLNSGDKGPFVLKQKLLQKGIAAQLIDNQINTINYQPLADKIAEKLQRKYQNKLPLRALKDKIIQNLTNKGFGYQEAKSACQSLELEKDQETETDLIYRELEKQYRKYSKKYDGYQLKQRTIQSLSRKGFGFDDINSALRDYL